MRSNSSNPGGNIAHYSMGSTASDEVMYEYIEDDQPNKAGKGKLIL